MRKLVIILMLFSLASYGQVTSFKGFRIADNTTQFGGNISIGNLVYNVAEGELWVATSSVASTETLTTASASFKLINTDEIDPIYAGDSSNIVWFADTISSIATRYDLDTITHFTNSDETDPIFNTHLASDITAVDTTYWGLDNQNLIGGSFDAGTNMLTVGIENGLSDQIDLSPLAGGDDWGSQTVESNATLTGSGITLSPLSVDSTNVMASKWFVSQHEDADADPTNELQTLSSDGTPGNISIDFGSTLNLNVDDADASITNELQNLQEVTTQGNTTTDTIHAGDFNVPTQGTYQYEGEDVIVIKSNTFDTRIGLKSGSDLFGAQTAIGHEAAMNVTGGGYFAGGAGAGKGAGTTFTAVGFSSGLNPDTVLNDFITLGYQAKPLYDGHFVIQQNNLNTTPLIEGNLNTGKVTIHDTLDMDYSNIVNVNYPQNPSDAANKKYVDDNLFTNADETDPIFTAHTTSNISDGAGFLKNNGTGTWSYDNNTYLTTETDPIYAGDSVNIVWFSDLNYFTTNDEIDPIYSADSSNIVWFSDLDYFTNTDETDPIFNAHLASAITATDTTNWGLDSDATNELNTYLSLINDTLKLTDAGGTLEQDLSGIAGNVSDSLNLPNLTNNYVPYWNDQFEDSPIQVNGGNVGIGTTNPTDPFDVKATLNNQRLIRISHPTYPELASGFIGFATDGGQTPNGVVTFGVQYGNTYYNVINIKRSTRYVGIGIASPTHRLHVDGGIRIGNTTTANTGVIRWTGTDYEGYDGTTWQSFTEAATGGTDDQTASEVDISDAGGYYTSTDVEGALQEIGGGTSDSLWNSDNTILYNEYPNYRLILHSDNNYTGGLAPEGSVELNGSSSGIFLNGTSTDAGRINIFDNANLASSQIGRHDGENFITRKIAGDTIYKVDKDGHTMSQSSTLKQFLKLDPQSTTPTPELGKIYLRESDSTLQFYNGTAWKEIQLN